MTPRTPRINEFRHVIEGMDLGGIDLNRWRLDIIARLWDDMEGERVGISTRDFCTEYFGVGNDSTENMLFMGAQMQHVRRMLEERPVPMFLVNRSYRWYIPHPSDRAMARGFLLDRTRRIVNAYIRIQRSVEIGQETYALPPTDTLIMAIEGSEQAMEQLEAGLEPESDD